MNKPSTIAPVVVPPGAGPHLRAFGAENIVHLSGEQTGGKFTLSASSPSAPGTAFIFQKSDPAGIWMAAEVWCNFPGVPVVFV